jgi:hypothetical protein
MLLTTRYRNLTKKQKEKTTYYIITTFWLHFLRQNLPLTHRFLFFGTNTSVSFPNLNLNLNLHHNYENSKTSYKF